MQKPPQDRARISGRELALLLDLEYPGQFNAARYRLQKVLDRKTHALADYPHEMFGTTGVTPREAAQKRAARKEFDASHVLVVPEWGGIKWPGTEWSYDRRKGEAIRDQGSDALLPGIGESRVLHDQG
jgi:hypothetical protein